MCGDLVVTYAFETSEQWITLTPPLLAETGIPLNEVHHRGLQRLYDRVSEYGIRLLEGQGAYLLHLGPHEFNSHLEAACVLLDPVWDMLVKELDPHGELLVCIPTRSHLVALDSAKMDANGFALTKAKEMFNADQVHGLSLQLMQRNTSELVLWQEF